MSSQPPSLRSISNNNILLSSLKSGSMVRSYSQDVGPCPPENINISPKPAQSETALDRTVKQKTVKQQTIKEQPSVSLEDDVYSTDSSMVDEEIKKRKRKIFGFPKKSKPKGD